MGGGDESTQPAARLGGGLWGSSTHDGAKFPGGFNGPPPLPFSPPSPSPRRGPTLRNGRGMSLPQSDCQAMSPGTSRWNPTPS